MFKRVLQMGHLSGFKRWWARIASARVMGLARADRAPSKAGVLASSIYLRFCGLIFPGGEPILEIVFWIANKRWFRFL